MGSEVVGHEGNEAEGVRCIHLEVVAGSGQGVRRRVSEEVGVLGVCLPGVAFVVQQADAGSEDPACRTRVMPRRTEDLCVRKTYTGQSSILVC
jgi:hypothetical protein